MIKHISFDVWNTLITANPEYAKERSEIIAHYAEVSLDSAKTAYSKAKHILDSEAELGFCDGTDYAWSILGTYLGVENFKVEKIRRECEELFLYHPPKIDYHLIKALNKLGWTYWLSVKSNTNFISGEILTEACDFDLWGCFDFIHFSDEYEVSKPDPKFFQMTCEATGLQPSEILHIGDNLICDGKCVDVGMQFCYVSSPEDLLNKLKTGELI